MESVEGEPRVQDEGDVDIIGFGGAHDFPEDVRIGTDAAAASSRPYTRRGSNVVEEDDALSDAPCAASLHPVQKLNPSPPPLTPKSVGTLKI